MENYLMYIVVAALTIASPGPGVILTINNSIQRGAVKTIAGISGIALGMLLISIVSATSLGVVLANSAVAFTIVKFVGATYLIYLGIKMWRAKTSLKTHVGLEGKSVCKCFFEGLSLTVSNPKPILFFMSLFPQFISSTDNYVFQFITLSQIFSVLVVFIHTIYALLASLAKNKLSTANGTKSLNRVSGGVFVCFGIGLATSGR